jgi:hypothetical protein
MMSRADQSWPDDETVEIPTDENEAEPANTGTLINDLINVVERTEKGRSESGVQSTPSKSCTDVFRDVLIGI